MNRRFYTLILSFFAATFTVSAQDADMDLLEQRTEEFSRSIERFVDNLVDRPMYDDGMAGRRFDRYDEEDSVKSEAKDAVTLNGTTEIAVTDTIHDDLVVKNGDLTIRGAVFGDVLVVNGNVTIAGTAKVYGNVRAMNGSVSKETGAFVEGYTEESSGVDTRKTRKRTSRAKYAYSFRPYFWNTESAIEDNVLFRYNRVEGVFLGFGSEKKFYWDGSRTLSGSGSFGYGFSSHKWRLQLALDRQFSASGDVLYETGAEVHSMTDTKDEWIMNLGENNLAAILFREDYRDYFQREGFSAHLARYTKDGDVSSVIDLRYGSDRYSSMVNAAQWSLFSGDPFRVNPTVAPGIMRSVQVSMGLSTVEKYRSRMEGWNIYGKGEVAGNGLGGDFDVTQGVIDVRRFQPLGGDDQLNMRFRIASVQGAVIPQRSLELGGANTLPAYGFKSLTGNRMMLLNMEYRLSDDLLDEIFFWPDFLGLLALADAGAITQVKTSRPVYDGFDALTSSTIKSDLGCAITWHDGDARLGFSWRTDVRSPVMVFFRMNRAF